LIEVPVSECGNMETIAGEPSAGKRGFFTHIEPQLLSGYAVSISSPVVREGWWSEGALKVGKESCIIPGPSTRAY